VGGEESFEEECLCKPRAGGSPAIKWEYLHAARRPETEALRFRIAGDDMTAVEAAAEAIVAALAQGGRAELGYDVARTGHLSAVWVNAREGALHVLRALVTFQGSRFGTQRSLIEACLKGCRRLVGAGDKTGLGMQVCEELEDRFGKARFVGVNFSASKPDLGTRLTRVYEDGNQALPAGQAWADVEYDLAGIRSQPLPSGRLQFYETPNPIEKRSHCDIAWANALALLAGEDAGECGFDAAR
jgi:phage FluMu gp28-like protein